MSYKNKYLKYKNKYLKFKKQFGGNKSKVINPINGKEYFYKTKDEWDDDVFTSRTINNY